MLIGAPDAAYTEQAIQTAQEIWQTIGREGQPEIILRVNHSSISGADMGADRPFLGGSVAQVKADVQKLAAWGVTEIFFSHISPYGDQADGFAEMMWQAQFTRGVV